MTSLALNFRRYIHPDYWFPPFSITVISAALLALFLDLTIGGSGPFYTSEIGKIYYKNHIAQRKFASQVIWSDVDLGEKLYNLDTIRTDENSEIIIKLNDGTRIDMDQNSMIVLWISGDQTNVNFQGGSVRTLPRADSENKSNVMINAGNKIIAAITGGDIRLTGKDERKVIVTVKKGNADLFVSGQKQKLKKNDEARIDGDAVKIKNLKLKQTFPEESSKILIEGTETAVDFKWEAQKGTDLVLELSRRPDMEIVSYRKKSSKENESVSLKTGTHYWRIASSDGTQTSEIRNIRIIQKKPVHLYSPVNNRAFIYRESPPLISFSWSNNDPGTSYLLEYSNDSSFENPVQIRLRSGRISRYLAEGDYYWRVTHGEKDAVIARSPVQQFSVKKTEAYSPPRLINPVENSELDEPVFSNQGVMFNWLSSGQIKLFELEISDDPQFKNILFKESTDANYQTVIQKFHQGRYYWRVKGKDAGGIYTDYSKPKSFRVIFPRKITHLYPRQNYIMEINDYNEAGLQFGWKPIGIGGKYRILISRSEDMKQSVLDRIVGWNRVNVYLLNPGAFYWKVQMLGTNRNVLLESPVRKLTILDNLSAPEMIDPKRGETIDLTQEENLVFRLKKVPGAENYVLYLYETEGNRKIFRKILTSENYVFQDLDILNTGEFYWTITALTTRNKREIRSKTVKGHFKIKVKLLKPPEFNF